MKKYRVEVVNIEGTVHYYPQYKALVGWRYIRDHRYELPVCCDTMREAEVIIINDKALRHCSTKYYQYV